jgi:hypothetical protein
MRESLCRFWWCLIGILCRECGYECVGIEREIYCIIECDGDARFFDGDRIIILIDVGI